MSRTRVFEWHKRFREGRTDVEDDERSRRPTISKTTNNVQEIEKIVREDRRLSIQLRAERMTIDKETVWQVLHDNLYMTKVCAQVVSKLLTSDQKEKRQEICANILKQIEEKPKFLNGVITVPAMRDEFSSTTQQGCSRDRLVRDQDRKILPRPRSVSISILASRPRPAKFETKTETEKMTSSIVFSIF